MIRKGRPLSNAARTGRHATAPRDPLDPQNGAETDQPDSFDPFESFEAHDRAAGLGSRRARVPAFRSAKLDSDSDPASDPFAARKRAGALGATEAAEVTEPTEATYTRSRRTPGEAKPGQDEPKKSNRPARSLKGRALGYLSRREYSRSELARKLKPFVEETDSLDTLLDSLEAENWLSNSRFTESLIHRRSSKLGTSRILGELKQHAVDQSLVEEASAQLRETELARAQAVWRKKFRQLPETPAERAKQARFLASRGFSGATIGKILKGIDEEWSGD